MNLDDARRHASELSPDDVEDSPREDHLVEIILALRAEVDRLHAALDTVAGAIAAARAGAAAPPLDHRARRSPRLRPWLPEEDQILEAHPLLTADELTGVLGRTEAAIKTRRSKLTARANRQALAGMDTP